MVMYMYMYIYITIDIYVYVMYMYMYWLCICISSLGLIMYIISTFEFPTHNLKFHLLTTSVNAKYYY